MDEQLGLPFGRKRRRRTAPDEKGTIRQLCRPWFPKRIHREDQINERGSRVTVKARGMQWYSPILVLMMGLGAAHAQTPPPARPNVVWIVLDALRPSNLSCYGHDRETSPSIDGMARQGVLFKNHYAQAFWTFPSVPSYMTGRYFPANCLDSGKWEDQVAVPPADEILLPTLMRKAGYRTLLATSHSWFSPFCRLVEAFEQHELDVDWDAFKEEVSTFLGQQDPRPFFAYIHMMHTHFPHVLTPPYDKWIRPDYVSKRIVNGNQPSASSDPLDENDRELLRGLYDGGILYADQAVNDVIEELKHHGLLENTIIIIGTDHGEALGEDGYSVGHAILCEEVMHIPLIISGPGIERGLTVEEPTENVDIVPTLVHLLNLPSQASFDGRDLSDIMAGAITTSHQARQFVFAKNYNADGSVQLVVRAPQFTYIYQPATDMGTLYHSPFGIAGMKDVADQFPAEIPALKDALTQVLVPKWNAFCALPQQPPTKPFTLRLAVGNIKPQDAFVADPSKLDGSIPETRTKWCLFSGSGILYALRNAELPEVTVSYSLPNGRYHFGMGIWAESLNVLKVAVQEESTLKPVERSEHKEVIDLGDHEVTNGEFHFTLKRDVVDAAFSFGGLVVVPSDSQQNAEVPPAIVLELREKLRALGYAGV